MVSLLEESVPLLGGLTPYQPVDYLLNPPYLIVSGISTLPPRPRAAIAILVIYYILLFTLVTSYARLIQVIITNPGYVPRGARWRANNIRSDSNSIKYHEKRWNKHRSFAEKIASSPAWPSHSPPSGRTGESGLSFADAEAGNREHFRAEDFWLKDVFVCNFDGRPSFCSTCLNFKPDRAHHCREVDRCVKKMDHFCPWVGGIVSETSFKFFLQFLFYAALFCTHVLIVMAYFVAERRRDPDWLDVNWILILGFASLFWLFSFGMFVSSFHLALVNSTTVENLSKGSKIWYLAVYLPRPEETQHHLSRVDEQGRRHDARTITYPRPPEEQQFRHEHARPSPEAQAERPVELVNIPPDSPNSNLPAPQRTFVILEMEPGDNPWDLGLMSNLHQIFGYHIIDWILPMRYSPSADHSNKESMFRLGPVVRRRLVERGLLDDESEKHKPARNKRCRRRRSRRKSHAHPRTRGLSG